MKATNKLSNKQAAVIGALWLGYGVFYFCRSNSAVFQIGLQREMQLSNEELGYILGAFKLTYAVGQLVSGQLAERFSPRIMMAAGLLGSAALNITLGLGTGFYFFLFVWALNGWMQAMGWAPTMRVAANWFEPQKRGLAVGIIGTGYSVTATLTWVIAAAVADAWGWRWALYLPAAVCIVVAIFLVVFLRDSPTKDVRARDARGSSWRMLRNPRLWLLGLSLAFIDACRYGFADWGIKHLTEVAGGSLTLSAVKLAVLPISGAAGAVLSGTFSDRYFGGRRAPAIALLGIGLSAASVVYGLSSTSGLVVVSLAFIGFSIGGAQTLLVGAAPMDLVGQSPAAAVGFVNMFGYFGALMQNLVTPRLVRVPLFVKQGAPDWDHVVWFWAGCALAASVVLIPLWRTIANNGEPDIKLSSTRRFAGSAEKP